MMKFEVSALNWIRLQNLNKAGSLMPPLPGVYAFGSVTSVLRLPLDITWVYIGESKNLKNRFIGHTIETETNIELRTWLRSHPKDAELWFAITKDHINTERELIRHLVPIFNKKLYGGKKNT